MNIAIGIGTLLLGGWVMPDTAGQPQPDVPVPRIEQPKSSGRPDTIRSRPSSGYEYSAPQPRTVNQGGDEEQMIPLPPTDPLLQSPDSPWATPTQTKPGAQSRGFGSRPYGSGMSPQRPTARTTQRSARSYGSSATAGRPVFRPNIDLVGMQQAPTPQVETGPKPRAAGAALGKPFTNYSTPSGISPYMGLYAYNPTGSINNNYETIVRPQLEQQRMNRIAGGEIRGLQSRAQLQAAALQRLGKQSHTLGGTLAPEYFQNLGNYYPGLAH